ncbi:MAG: hypothetical protein KKI08_13785, partial [Armatimonadetes bacterium]|nr:hypothetical protein [Armatimonadota bacterium]
LTVMPASVRLRYTITWRDGRREPEDIDYAVPVVWTPCHFGGKRPWLLCPGRECGRRVAKLYRPPASRYFLCRHCHGLVCASQGQDEFFCLLQRAWRLKARVGGKPGLQYPFPVIPQRMHWRTYQRLLTNYQQAVHRACRLGLDDSAKSSARLHKLCQPRRRRNAAERLPMSSQSVLV